MVKSKQASIPALTIGGTHIPAGQRVTLDLPITDLYTHAKLTMPVHVVRGRRPGPTVFVSAALHGDEINGVEIIRRLLKMAALRSLRGTLIAVPIVNVHGFLRHSRYLPDRRDLNRCFPGSEHGSVAARLARVFVAEILEKSDYGIDLHTGAIHRPNLPQIRANLDDPETRRMAEAFGCPLMVNAALREGSLREYAHTCGVPLLLYEAGEALRFDEFSIRAGVRGVTGVLRELKMLPLRGRRKAAPTPVIALDSNWVRAPESGILRSVVELGARVVKGQTLALVADPFGEKEVEVRAEHAGVVIGRSNLPLAHAGDALYHVAKVSSARKVAGRVEAFQSEHEPENGGGDEEWDEPPIV
ncbi:succinylglutamate desuccinylase/aspartoacylase [Salinisphaera sp. PC39]|uniref:succinylglutamate desuccinylase/aspartoacylase family protein n=1 Tax=Salinisphaera sp. PC39 TaxID=1304156 RepID=UPI0033425354